MHVVAWSVSLGIAWILQLQQCVPVIGADQPVYSTRTTSDNRIPGHPSDSHPVHPYAVEGSANVAVVDRYPVLTTGSPLSVARPEYADGAGDYRRETDIRRPEYWTNHGSNVDPSWNSYQHGGYRRLKKYQVPVVVEMDEVVDYDDAEGDKSTGWYDEGPGHDAPAGHADSHHWARRPGHAADVNRLTAAKIAVVKLKAAKAMKIVLLLAAKLKLLVLFKLHLFAKLFALAKALKLLTALPGPWPFLANASAAAVVMASVLNAASAANTGNVIGATATTRCGYTSANGSRDGAARDSRKAAVATSLASQWTNGFLSYLVDHIRKRNWKSVKSTFKEISGYRSKKY